MSYASYIPLIPLLPLAGFVLLGLFGKKSFAGWLSTSILTVCTALSAIAAWQYFSAPAPVMVLKYTWLQFSTTLAIDMGILLDTPSVMMLVVITFVSLMVHIFSLGYMKGEGRIATYFSFLLLFTFSMLGLVLSTNMLQIYIFWELVGLSSFLLIGFYYDRPAAVAASKKAFIVTRFADVFFLIGILMLAFDSGTLDIGSITSANPWALLLIFIGGAGKSAMFPLHIWLPDAMEGPTPVSALIHAATMVVAGVYLVARLYHLFEVHTALMQFITWIGVVSALLAAIIACTQTDIKRVLAYSTISQIGFMMFAMGMSGYTASLFHLFTHAFFKALLFLGAGAVIHFVHSNELSNMGGLRKLMPVTHGSFLIACLAIAGIPPFAGFFSKEAILLTAWENNTLVFYMALLTSGLTAFYMFRLYFLVFWSTEREVQHGSEGGVAIKLPMILLSMGALAAGWVRIDFHIGFAIAPVAVAIAGIVLAYSLYRNKRLGPPRRGVVYKAFYFDSLYLFVTKKILFNLIGRPAAWIDKHVVDGTMNALATNTARLSAAIKTWQSGRVQHYALYFFGGAIALAALFIYLL